MHPVTVHAKHRHCPKFVYRFLYHIRTEASFYDHVLQQLGSSRADNFTLCVLGTTDNGLVTCEVSVTRKKVIHMMPALSPSLEDCPPKTEQVTL